jgi:hypothetical protein
MFAMHTRGLYHLTISPQSSDISTHLAIDINVLHRRMGHANLACLKRMVAARQLANVGKVTGIPEFCEPCALRKMKKQLFKSCCGPKAKCPFELIHSNVGGPISPTSRQGY